MSSLLSIVQVVGLVILAGCTRDHVAVTSTANPALALHSAPAARVLMILPDWLPSAENDVNVATVRAGFEAAGLDGDKLRLEAAVLPAMPGEARVPVLAAIDSFKPHLVIVTTMGPAIDIQQMGTAVPVVFSGGSDPVELCLVESYARPGHQATGYTSSMLIEGKMVELLVDAFPDVRDVVVLVEGNVMSSAHKCGIAAGRQAAAQRLADAGCQAGSQVRPEDLDLMVERRVLTEAAQRYNVELKFEVVCTLTDIEQAVRNSKGMPTVGFLMPDQFLLQTNARRIAEVFNSSAVPAVFGNGRYAELGALLAVGPRRQPSAMQEAAEMARLILDGADPADMPVRTPRGSAIWVNLKAAESSGLYPSANVVRAADTFIR